MATKFDIKTEALKPLLAGVGVTDLAVEAVRDAVTDVQKRAAAVQKDVREFDAKAEAKARRNAIEARVSLLQAEAKAYPTKVSTQLSTLVDENVAAANATYTDLVKRGESLVTRIRRQESTKATVKSAKTTATKAKTTATQAKKAVDANATAADKTAATKVAPKPKKTAKKATRSAAAKKASATTARKTAAKKTTAAQSSAKATTTAAQATASNAVKAVADAAEKIGD